MNIVGVSSSSLPLPARQNINPLDPPPPKSSVNPARETDQALRINPNDYPPPPPGANLDADTGSASDTTSINSIDLLA